MNALPFALQLAVQLWFGLVLLVAVFVGLGVLAARYAAKANGVRALLKGFGVAHTAAGLVIGLYLPTYMPNTPDSPAGIFAVVALLIVGGTFLLLGITFLVAGQLARLPGDGTPSLAGTPDAKGRGSI